MCTDRDALVEIVLLKLQNICHKINYPEECSTSNDIVTKLWDHSFPK